MKKQFLPALAVFLAFANLVNVQAQQFLSQENHKDLPWPNGIKIDKDFQLNGFVYVYNHETHSFDQYQNISASIFVDSTGNRFKTILRADIPNNGNTQAVTFEDCNKHLVYQQIDLDKRCYTQPLPLEYNITKVITNALDQTSGATSYKGLKKLEWSDIQYHVFRMIIREPDEGLEFFFSAVDRELKYITIDDKPFVFTTPEGIIKRKYTDDDFMFDICPSNLNRYDNYGGFSQQIDNLHHIISKLMKQ